MSDPNLSFSVVIPVYNGEQYIKRAIDSCLDQRVLPNEIIVVDDASTDDTLNAVSSVNSPLVSYLVNEQNRGPSFCRNLGMKKANSAWILFLDADDVFHKEKIAVISLCLQTNNTIRAIGHAFDMPGKIATGNSDTRTVKQPVPERLSVLQVLLRNRMVTPSLAVASGNTVLFDETLKYAEDHDFIVRTAEKYGIWYLDMPLCSLYRLPLTTGGQSSHKWRMRKGEIRMYIKYCKRNGLFLLIPVFVLFSLVKHLKNGMVAGR